MLFLSPCQPPLLFFSAANFLTRRFRSFKHGGGPSLAAFIPVLRQAKQDGQIHAPH
jgi:hypothetical protein